MVQRFDREWAHFAKVGTAEQQRMFEQYFDLVDWEDLGSYPVALDAGCGAGRWAYQLARRGSRVIALDLGRSIEVAARNTRDTGRVACIQADVTALPVRAKSVDLVYSLGVLHHVERSQDALRDLVMASRQGGQVLIYLYYALDGRSLAYRALFRVIDRIRQYTSGLPQLPLELFSAAVAALVYLPLATAARVLRAVGVHRAAAQIPLSQYSGSSFETMRNDSLDRFGTRLEKRFTRTDVESLLVSAGLTNVRVSPLPPYWHAVGRR